MDIDAVVTWVDGNDPAHAAKRARYLNYESDRGSEATLAKRWEGANEITLCLCSIARHAPWFRLIWIITDNQTPDLSCLPANIRAKIRIVSHEHIFGAEAYLLPTFNSVSIETFMWRIDGLSDRFVYFNDDFLLINATRPDDFFQGERTVLRGRWERIPPERSEDFFAVNMYRRHKLNAARLYGYDQDNFFSIAHVAIPLRRSVIERAFAGDPQRLVENASHRFRDPGQFHLPSLFCNAAIKEDRAVIREQQDWKNFTSRYCQKAGTFTPILRLMMHKLAGYRLFCINDLQLLGCRSPLIHPTLRLIAGVRRRG